MVARFNALARATGGRPRFITLRTCCRTMVAIALSSVAVARQSALARKVQGTSSRRKSFRRFVAVSSTHKSRVASFDGMEWNGLDSGRDLATPRCSSSGVAFDESGIVKSVRFPSKTVPSRLRIAIRSLSCDAMRCVRRRATTRRYRCARGSVRWISYHRMPSVDASVTRSTRASGRAYERKRSIDGTDGAIRSLDMVLIGT